MTTRVPRPLGTTTLAQTYNNNKTNESKDELLQHLTSQYTLQGFRILNIPITISQFANLLNIDEPILMHYISKVSKTVGAFSNPDQIQDTLLSIQSLSMNWAIEDRGLIMEQIETLRSAQAGNYKPFISAELTKALKTGQDSNKNFMELYKTFFTNQNPIILNQINNNKQENHITPKEAFELMQQSNKAISKAPSSLPQHSDDEGESDSNSGLKKEQLNDSILDPNTLSGLWEKEALGTLPDVREKRSGSEALVPKQPPMSQGVTKPAGQQAIPKNDQSHDNVVAPKSTQKGTPEASKPDSHKDFENRRGEAYIDYDEVD